MDTAEILAELAAALDRLAEQGDVVLGVSQAESDLVTWDLSPDAARALADGLRLALGEDGG